MPEFILDTSGVASVAYSDPRHGTAAKAITWRALDSFTQGYIEALFFTWPDGEGGFIGGITSPAFGDLAPETVANIIADCAAFQDTATLALAAALEETEENSDFEPLDDAQAGRDFWYTRNGHGCGFWDGDWPEPYATTLCKAAEDMGWVDAYLGDDGQVYLS